jgi:hypothetical protein
VARYLEAESPVLRESSSLEAADVVLVTGDDFTGIRDEPRAVDATTTTAGDGTTTTSAPDLSDDELLERFLAEMARNQCQN